MNEIFDDSARVPLSPEETARLYANILSEALGSQAEATLTGQAEGAASVVTKALEVNAGALPDAEEAKLLHDAALDLRNAEQLHLQNEVESGFRTMQGLEVTAQELVSLTATLTQLEKQGTPVDALFVIRHIRDRVFPALCNSSADHAAQSQQAFASSGTEYRMIPPLRDMLDQ
jgi:hypothetical protein